LVSKQYLISTPSFAWTTIIYFYISTIENASAIVVGDIYIAWATVKKSITVIKRWKALLVVKKLNFFI